MMRGAPALLVAGTMALGCGRAPDPSISETKPQVGAPAPSADPWEQARLDGIELRAIGTEPGWALELDEQGMMTLVYAYGERQASMPAPAAHVADGVTTYEGVTDEHVLKVVSRAGACSDGMSDRAYPLIVSVTIDGVALRGCGRWLDGRR